MGIPAYFSQVARARENSSNNAALAAAKVCAAAGISGDVALYEAGTGITGDCNAIGTVFNFTAAVGGLGTEAVATVSTAGGVALTTPAAI